MVAATHRNEDGFRRVVEHHRTELRAYCRRLLGSAHDAEDAMQDAMLRAWRGLSGLKDRDRLRPWLFAIATNTCRDQIQRRSKGIVQSGGGQYMPSSPLGPPLADAAPVRRSARAQLGDEDSGMTPEARCEEREALELAGLAALRYLPGRQRAVLVLREVFGYSAREVAEALETTVPAVNSALQRARKTVNERVPAQRQFATLRSTRDRRLRDAVEHFIEAFDAGDIDGVVAALADDVPIAPEP
jgi:RNA polymerase sigma-70 factor (ECF subfamily)